MDLLAGKSVLDDGDEDQTLHSNENQIKAVDMLIQGISNRTIQVHSKGENLDEVIERLKRVRARLQDIDGKLKLAVRSGLISTSVH